MYARSLLCNASLWRAAQQLLDVIASGSESEKLSPLLISRHFCSLPTGALTDCDQ